MHQSLSQEKLRAITRPFEQLGLLLYEMLWSSSYDHTPATFNSKLRLHKRETASKTTR